MKVKTSELSGAALDWAVAKCEGLQWATWRKDGWSNEWSMGGPIIEREVINIGRQAWDDNGVINWGASKSSLFQGAPFSVGPTPLVAAMRCYVASKLGEEVEVPDEIV